MIYVMSKEKEEVRSFGLVKKNRLLLWITIVMIIFSMLGCASTEEVSEANVATVASTDVTTEDWLDPNGTKLGIIETITDSNGNVIEAKWYGLDGNLTKNSDLGVAIVRRVYDEAGNIIEESYYDVDESPMVDVLAGVASVRVKYDSENRPVEQSYFGVDGKPAQDKIYGMALATFVYDEAGNLIETRAYDINGVTIF